MNDFPRKMKLMTDYQCWCLWDMDNPQNIDPDTLPISSELKVELGRWTAQFDATLDLNDHTKIGFKTEAEYQAFYDRGWELAELIKQELPRVELWYFDRRHVRPVQMR